MPERYEVEPALYEELRAGDIIWHEGSWFEVVSTSPHAAGLWRVVGRYRDGSETDWARSPRLSILRVAARGGTEDELSSLLARLEGFLCERRRESPEHDFLYREVKTALAARAASTPEEKVYEIERDRFGLHFSGPSLANGECVRVRLVDRRQGSGCSA